MVVADKRSNAKKQQKTIAQQRVILGIKKSYTVVVNSLNTPTSIVFGLLYRRGQQKIEITPPTVKHEGHEEKEPQPRALMNAHIHQIR